MAVYHYIGPVRKFNTVVVREWEGETTASSLAKAISNLKYQAKKDLGYTSDARLLIDNSAVVCLDEVKNKPIKRDYNSDYDIPDEAEEMYGSNIFMKDEEFDNVVKVYTSSEHTGSYPNYFGYMHIEHPNLGDFYVSFSVRTGNVRVDGYPWKFLQGPGYKLNKDQKEWVMAHKKELNNLTGEVSGTIKLEDNFCTLNPGTVKLKRASKEFNQRDAKIKDEVKVFAVYYTDDKGKDMTTVRAESKDEAEDKFLAKNPKAKEWFIRSYKFENPEEASKYDYRRDYKDCAYKKIRDSYIKMDAYDLRDIFGRYYDEGLKERYNLNVSEDDFCFTGTTKVTGSREDLERFVREHFDNDHYHSNIYSLKSIKDWMPTKTTIDYITEKLDRAGIEYEIEDDVYGETAPFDTWITITRGDDSIADDIICSVVGSAYEWVRDKNGNRRYCKVVTDEDLIDEFNN